MSKRNTVHASILSALALTTLCLLPAVVNAQKGPQGTTGAPLKSVDVKLGKNPGGNPAVRTTGSNGEFDFGVVPAGSYYLIVSLKEKPKTNKEKPKAGQASEAGLPSYRSSQDVKSCLITIEGAVGGTIKREIKTTFQIDPNKAARLEAADEERIILESDGIHPLTGVCRTMTSKPKSNITNN